MAISLNGIMIENFKSYEKQQWIELEDLSVFLGANSSGKSTALQTLLALKQTVECNSPDIDLLLAGKYVTLGDFKDVINRIEKNYIRMGVSLNLQNELNDKDKNTIIWKFDAIDPEKEKIRLSALDFQLNGYNLSLTLKEDFIYSIAINGIKTQLLAEIRNLQIGEMYIEYDEKLNGIFHQFLSELLAQLTQKKKVASIEKTEMVALNGINEFFYLISNDIASLNKKEIEDDQFAVIANKIIKLIEEYRTAQYKEYAFFNTIPKYFRMALLTMAVYNLFQQHKDVNAIDHIIDKYKKMLQAYLEELKDGAKSFSKIEVSRMNLQNNIKKEESEMDKVRESFIIYREFLKEILGKIFYVGPIREKPLGLYNIGFETIPKYVGTTGAYFASVLLYENKEKEYLLPDGEKTETSLWDALDAWVLHLKVASGVHVERRNSFGISVSIENTQNKKSDIMNVGIGTSQVLPVLITGLLSEANETLIFEQPELHLHPYSQSRLVDFFIVLAKNNRKVMIETHSEYFILRLRYHILTEHINESQLAINFFQNEYGTQVKKGEISSYGHLEYPDDFKDETQELINDLMQAAMMKGKRNEQRSTD